MLAGFQGLATATSPGTPTRHGAALGNPPVPCPVAYRSPVQPHSRATTPPWRWPCWVHLSYLHKNYRQAITSIRSESVGQAKEWRPGTEPSWISNSTPCAFCLAPDPSACLRTSRELSRVTNASMLTRRAKGRVARTWGKGEGRGYKHYRHKQQTSPIAFTKAPCWSKPNLAAGVQTPSYWWGNKPHSF